MNPYNKKIYDAVHGFIRFNELERELIDSIPFQRLHHIHQLGISFLVYPGATHTRFEHSLGTMELTTRIFDHLFLKQMSHEEAGYWKQILRFAALCHDMGHLPFSHDAEKPILGKGGHEKWTVKIIQSEWLRPVWDQLQELVPNRNVALDVLKMASGQEKLQEMGVDVTMTSLENLLSEIITGDFFGADRIDYLLRDAQCTGVSYGLFDYQQLIEMLCILEQDGELALGIEENGIESCEALLLARHFMHQRVYQYSSVQSYKFHLKRFMHAYYTQRNFLSSLDQYLSQSDNEIMAAVRYAANHPQEIGHADAAGLLKREYRFRAIEIEKGITESDLQEIQQSLSIPSEFIAWSVSPHSKNNKGLNFLARLRSGAVVPAAGSSDIIVPSKTLNWLFISPEFEQAVRLKLEGSQPCFNR